MNSKSLSIHIERNFMDKDDKLALVQFPAMRSQFDDDPDSISLSIKHSTFRMRLNKEGGNIYASSKNNIDDPQLFICKRVNDKIVCVPLSHVCTIRSDFSHLNPKEEVDPREEIRPVSVKFSANDRHQIPGKMQNREQEIDDSNEDFRPLSFKTMLDKYADLQRESLFGKDIEIKIKPDPDAGPIDAEPIDVKPDLNTLSDIKPKIEKMDVYDIYSLDNNQAQSTKAISELTRKRVRECLIKAKLVSFHEVHRFLSSYPRSSNSKASYDEQILPNSKDILDALNEYAILVQGNWAIKSEVLYGDSGVRDHTDVTGIPINLFTASRDFLLWLFNQNRVVSRTQYSKRVKIPDHDILDLFNQLSIYRKDIKKWELKLATDEKFLKTFPDVVQRQTTFWKVRKANKLSIFNK